MKNLSNILRRSDLNPLERVTTLVHHNVQKDKTGKGILSEAEFRSIAELWIPKNNYEVKQYNKYRRIAELETSMRIDAQIFLYQSDSSLLRAHRILDRIILGRIDLDELHSNDNAKDYVSESESITFLTQKTYLEYDEVLHKMTFFNLPDDVQKDLKTLDEYILKNLKYFQDEVTLFEIFDSNTSLNESQEKRLVNILYDSTYSEKLRKRRNGSEKDGFLTYHFFAGIRVVDILYKCADYLYISYDINDKTHLRNLLDDLESYANNKQSSIEYIIKPLLSRWLDEGLFVSEYIPLCHSDGMDTWNGSVTKTHKELFTLWYEELQKSKKYLQDLVGQNVLVLEKAKNSVSEEITIITGNSIYLCSEDISFVNEYKEQLNRILPLSNIFLFIQEHAYPVKSYKTLDMFITISKEFSELFDIDMSEWYTDYRDEYIKQVNMINISFQILLTNIQEYLRDDDSWNYMIKITDSGFVFDIHVDEDVSEIVNLYDAKVKELNK